MMDPEPSPPRPDWRLVAQKWLIWLGLIGVLILLRDLFPVIFFTFILAYIGNSVIGLLSRRFPKLATRRRPILAVLYFLFILGIIGIGSIIIPRLFIETRDLARAFITHEEIVELQDPATTIDPTGPGRPVRPGATIGEAPAPVGGDLQHSIIHRETRRYLDRFILQVFGRDSLDKFRESGAYEAIVTRIEGSIMGLIPQVVEGVRLFVNGFLSLAFQFFLAIIFSFLILWDLPRMRARMLELQYGRTAKIYREIAPSIVSFGIVVGRAFEAQTIIAIVNVILTVILFFILQIPSIALLGTIVFFCSYIPVVGVILSTLPASLLAFKVGGVVLVLWLVIGILVVHAIEAYGLNPMIYGHHMRIHPVAVLIILLIGEELVGIWGLILGVPIFVFFLRYVIRGEGPAEITQPMGETGEGEAVHSS
jgi:predicted PurR-regulated permease PerM